MAVTSDKDSKNEDKEDMEGKKLKNNPKKDSLYQDFTLKNIQGLFLPLDAFIRWAEEKETVEEEKCWPWWIVWMLPFYMLLFSLHC